MDLTNINKDRKSKRKTTIDLSSMVYGKVPPQSKSFEQAILGAILMDKNSFDVVLEILRPEMFYIDAHSRIFNAMRSLSQKSQPIDMLTVVEELKAREELDIVGGPYYVTTLTNNVIASANIEAHCKVVKTKYIQRELIKMSGETIQEAYEDSANLSELLNNHEKKFTELTTGSTETTYTRVDSELVKRVARIEQLRHQKQHITGVPSGFPDLDRITHGWQDTDLIILAARPSVGKTAFALNLARNATKYPDKPRAVGFFSLEMSKGQLIDRLLSSESDVNIEHISNGYLDDEAMEIVYRKGIQPLAKAQIFIDDTPALNSYELRARARRMKRKHQVDLILIDYLQLMSGSNEKSNNREQEISKISRDLKGLAKELHIPIIALSQLSRAPELRKGEMKMPQLSDLRESGAIEQDADVVMFLYRPEYYDVNSSEMGESTKGETHLKIAKHRNGRLETVKLLAKLDIQKFLTWEGQQALPAELPKVGRWKPVDGSDLFSDDNS